MGTGLVKYDDGGFALALKVGEAAAAAGQYGSKNAAELALRVQYGLELGLGPAQALNAIHVVQGKPSLTAGAIAAKLKGSGRYNYRVTEHTDQACTVVIYEGGREAGTSRFTIDDAQRAGLTKNPQWKNYPRNMLFSRAITNAARWYAADVFGGAVYTPDELGAHVDGETGEVIDHAPPPAALESGRPVDGEGVETPRDTHNRIRDALIADYGKDAVKHQWELMGSPLLDEGNAPELRGRLREQARMPRLDPDDEADVVEVHPDQETLV